MTGDDAVDAEDAVDADDAGDAVAADGPLDTDVPPGANGPPDADAPSETDDAVDVLEFAIGDDRYCIDVDYVEEIVADETPTRVPNTPAHVEGVVDLRGQITTVLDPKRLLDVDADADGPGTLLVVFDAAAFEGAGAVGWVVDEVRRVTAVTDAAVRDAPVDDPSVEGVVDDDGEGLVVWTDPAVLLERVTADATG